MANFGLIGIETVADILGVQTSRVRQLAKSPDFPRPAVSFGERARAWREDAIRAWKRSKEQGSTVAHLALPPATEPLRRVLDQVTSLPTDNPVAPYKDVYVRVWSGQDRTVALLEGLDGSGGIDYAIEDFATALVHQFPHILGGNVCWFRVMRSMEHSTDGIANVLFHRVADSHLTDPSWDSLDGIVRLRELVGEDVEWYPYGTLTEENVRRYQRGGTVVDVISNEQRIASRFGQLRLLKSAPIPERERRTAIDFVVSALRIEDSYAESSPGTFGNEEHAQLISRDAPVVNWAVVRRNRPLTDEERKELEAFASPEPHPGFDDTRTMALLDELTAWAERVDRYSDAPDPAVFESIEVIASGLPLTLTDRDLARVAELRVTQLSQPFVAYLDTRYPHVKRYLEAAGSMHAIPSAHRRRAQRILASAVAYSPTEEVLLGFDQYGTPIAQRADDAGRGSSTIAVLWPRQAAPVSLADWIVVEGKRDTIAYIAGSDRKPRGLLPRITTPRSTGWSVGYGGGGPGDLIDAICDLLTISGLAPASSKIRDVITDAESSETISLPVAQLVSASGYSEATGTDSAWLRRLTTVGESPTIR